MFLTTPAVIARVHGDRLALDSRLLQDRSAQLWQAQACGCALAPISPSTGTASQFGTQTVGTT